jgi:hypothetical protein
VTSPSVMNTRTWPRRLASNPVIAAGSDALRLRLLPSGDGWSLVDVDGELVFSAVGLSGRRRCLEFARAEGVILLVR